MATTESSAKPNSAGDPGLSLWLVPPEGSHIYNALSRAIAELVPSEIQPSDSAPKFEPHLTLASRIPRRSITSDPQKWLDEIDLPAISTVEVEFHELATGDMYFKKLFIRCKRSESLLRLASSCRAFSSATIDEAQYDPHASVL
jgi:2',3'-cyclic-nucleotide 3'-phosphodiesterase